MGECELCGKRTEDLTRTKIEQSTMLLCSNCSSHGKQFSPPKSNMRTIRVQEEQEELIVPDYKERIKKARQAQKLTVHDLANQIQEKESVLAHVESGHLVPTIKLAKKLEKKLHIIIYEQVSNSKKPEQVLLKEESKPVTMGDLLAQAMKKK